MVRSLSVASVDSYFMDRLAELETQIEALTAKADEAVTGLQQDPERFQEVKSVLDEIKPQVEALTAERDAQQKELETKAMAEALSNVTGELTTLKGAVEKLRQAPPGFFPDGDSDPEGKNLFEGDEAYQGGGFFRDVRLASRSKNSQALERLTAGLEGKGLNEEGKVLTPMTEGTNAQGGYLVRPLVERQIVAARESDNVLRGLCSKINVNTNSIQLDQLSFAAVAGWVAELAEKPSGGTFSLASITANVFTAAGLAVVSNQLLQDANPSVDALAVADITKRLVALEETAFMAGTGTGQPLGILNTPGIGATTVTDATATAPATIIDGILDAIAAVETNHGTPSAIVMHPRTWTALLKYKPTAGGAYLINPGSPNATFANVNEPRTVFNGPTRELWGYPVLLSNRIPTNLGAGTNESRVIVGDFREALILDRMGITVDESAHFLFTTNQTVFRVEERVGFTAARTPLAFNVVGGTALANR
jgi:HK97 family phage major capsid protein